MRPQPGPQQQSSTAQQMLQAMQRMLVVNQRLFDVSQRIHDHLTKTSPGQTPPITTPATATAQAAQQTPQQTPAIVPQQTGPGSGSLLSAGVNGLQQALRQMPLFGRAIDGFVGSLRHAAQQLGAVPRLAAAAPAAGPAALPLAGGASAASGAGGGGGAAAGGALAGFAAGGVALGAVATAAGAAATALQQVVSTSVSFVQLLNPGLVMQYNLALRDFSATVGQALTPIVEAATAITKTFGAVLGPVMESLKPVVEGVAQVFVNLSSTFSNTFARVAQAMQPLLELLAQQVQNLEPFFQAFASNLSALAGAFSVVANLFSGIFGLISQPIKLIGQAFAALSPLLEAFGAILAGIGGAIKGVFETLGQILAPVFNGLKAAIEYVRTALLSFAQSALVMAVRLASLIPVFGQSITDAIMKHLAPEKKDITGKAVPQNATVGDIGGLLQTMTRAALLAGPGGSMKPVDPMEAWRQETLQLLRELTGKAKQLNIEADMKKALSETKDKPLPGFTADAEATAKKLKRK